MLYLYFVVYGEGEPWKARVSNEADMVTVRGKRVMEGAFCRRRALCHKRQVRAIGEMCHGRRICAMEGIFGTGGFVL